MVYVNNAKRVHARQRPHQNCARRTRLGACSTRLRPSTNALRSPPCPYPRLGYGHGRRRGIGIHYSRPRCSCRSTSPSTSTSTTDRTLESPKTSSPRHSSGFPFDLRIPFTHGFNPPHAAHPFRHFYVHVQYRRNYRTHGSPVNATHHWNGELCRTRIWG